MTDPYLETYVWQHQGEDCVYAYGPEGRLYEIAAEGASEVTCEPGVPYIDYIMAVVDGASIVELGTLASEIQRQVRCLQGMRRP